MGSSQVKPTVPETEKVDEAWDKMALVDMSTLINFFSVCWQCGGTLKAKPILSFHGTAPIVKAECERCGRKTWNGQKKVPGTRKHKGNFDLAVSMHTTGVKHTVSKCYILSQKVFRRLPKH